MDCLYDDQGMTSRSSIGKTMVFMALFFFSVPAFSVAARIGVWETRINSAMTIIMGIFMVVGSCLIFMQYMQGSPDAQRNFVRLVTGLAIYGISHLLPGALQDIKKNIFWKNSIGQFTILGKLPFLFLNLWFFNQQNLHWLKYRTNLKGKKMSKKASNQCK